MAVSRTACGVENGHITMPDLAGIGFEGKSDLYAEMKALAD
jgi:L-alanine-DL-glutamate epimerase-like enolase superfamily enzyme